MPDQHGLIWTVHVERDDEKRWRETLGQDDINDWCAAHGWDAKKVCSGTVVVFGYQDGQAFVNAEEFARDAAGRIVRDHTDHGIKTHPLLNRLARSLPEGIGQVTHR